MSFYDRLNGLCIKNGQNISRFAIDVLKVSNATPTGWKKGSCPRADVVVEAAKYFGVTTDYLLELSDCMTASSSISDEEFEILAMLRNAPNEARAAAISSMRAIIDTIEQQKEVALTSCHSENDENEYCPKAAF